MGTVRIPLSSRKYPDLFAIIDESDYESVRQYRWHPRLNGHTFYAQYSGSRHGTNGKPVRLIMHRVILGLTDGDMPVDHINGNGLDNRRENLRMCDDSRNQANRHRLASGKSSRFRGVTLHKKTGKWQSSIKVNNKFIYLGLFASEDAAASAYNRAALEHFGEFASLNEVAA